VDDGGAVVGIFRPVALNRVIGCATFRSKRFEQFGVGKPPIIIHDAHVYRDVMNRERLTQHEFEAALRAAGVRPSLTYILQLSKITAKSASVVRTKTRLASGVDALGTGYGN
jgi:hypothetical protein